MGDEASELVVRAGGESYRRAVVQSVLSDLSREDLTVLKAIHEINSAPEEYPDTATAGGKRPATTGAIRHATDLTKRQVQYRLKPDGRGLETLGPDGVGLVRLRDPQPMHSGAIGPRSAETTPFGKAVLKIADERDDPMAVAVSSTTQIAHLEARVARLERVIKEHPDLELPPLIGKDDGEQNGEGDGDGEREGSGR